MKYEIRLKFTSQLRATKPPSYVNLAEKHIEAMRGRVLEILKAKLPTKKEKEIEKEVKEWMEGIMTAFPRKTFKLNGAEYEQVCFPARWILGFMENKIRALRLHTQIPAEAIHQNVFVKPSLIGLIKDGKPVTETVLEEEGIVSRDSSRKRSAIKHFETVLPPCYTQKFYVIVDGGISLEMMRKIFARGRLGASRGQGCGEFTGYIKPIED